MPDWPYSYLLTLTIPVQGVPARVHHPLASTKVDRLSEVSMIALLIQIQSCEN